MKQKLHFKRIFASLLLLAVSTLSWAQEVDGIEYIFGESEAIVTSGDYSGNVVIPSSVTYEDKTYIVTSIDQGAFCRCDGLTSVTIPNSVTSIDDNAFDGCTGLTSITIPNSVKSIGWLAFASCI